MLRKTIIVLSLMVGTFAVQADTILYKMVHTSGAQKAFGSLDGPFKQLSPQEVRIDCPKNLLDGELKYDTVHGVFTIPSLPSDIYVVQKSFRFPNTDLQRDAVTAPMISALTPEPKFDLEVVFSPDQSEVTFGHVVYYTDSLKQGQVTCMNSSYVFRRVSS